jgi:hypothetical protein
MKTWQKIVLIILLAAVYSALVERLLPKDRDDYLQTIYDQYNGWWFGDELPKDVILRYGPAVDVQGRSNMAITRMHYGRFITEFNPKYNQADTHLKMNMLHEQCHIATWGQEFDDHGPKFQACMLRLANQGAFNSLW